MENPQDITSITPSDYVGDLLAKQLKSAVDQNPSLLKEIQSFLLNDTPDQNPLIRESDPLFFDSAKNGCKYHICCVGSR